MAWETGTVSIAGGLAEIIAHNAPSPVGFENGQLGLDHDEPVKFVRDRTNPDWAIHVVSRLSAGHLTAYLRNSLSLSPEATDWLEDWAVLHHAKADALKTKAGRKRRLKAAESEFRALGKGLKRREGTIEIDDLKSAARRKGS